MKEYFTIGEISALTGLSCHALRYYDKIHLVTPTVVNEQNGYRYYSFLQLFTLDWVHHLQQFGFSLDAIREILSDSTADTLTRQFAAKKSELDDTLARLTVLRDTVEHYLAYYRNLDNRVLPELPFTTREARRFVFAEPYRAGEPRYGTAGYRLMAKKNRPEYSGLFFLRRTGYVLDYAALREGRVCPVNYYMFLEKPPAAPFPEVQELPAGSWLCFRCRALSPDADLSGLERVLRDLSGERLAVASEYDHSLDDSIASYEQSFFEVQVLLTAEDEGEKH